MIIDMRIKTCKHRCHLLEGYVGMKRIKFGAEMGYKKCVTCECHFFKTESIYCECCSTKLRVKNPRRTTSTKEKAQRFLMEISQ